MSKLIPLDQRVNMRLIKLSFIATLKIKQLLCVIRLLFMTFLVLVVETILFAKQKEHDMKGQFNMLGLGITVLFTNISMTGQVLDVAFLNLFLFMSSSPI